MIKLQLYQTNKSIVRLLSVRVSSQYSFQRAWLLYQPPVLFAFGQRFDLGTVVRGNGYCFTPRREFTKAGLAASFHATLPAFFLPSAATTLGGVPPEPAGPGGVGVRTCFAPNSGDSATP